ncbi:MAG: GGDEF domain-containing protein [Rhizobium sp.]|nr:GGDEF domain-containing protein [Rhizobium sp.]
MACVSAGISVLIAASVVPVLGGSYDGIGMWLSLICPLVIAFPASALQFHQGEKLRKARDELAALQAERDEMHAKLMQTHAALQQKSRLDAMTGALTREAFLTELNAASAAGRKGTLLLADADHFKRINDNFGHQTGDEALVAIAGAIAATTGVNDFWGRIGGEEFAIFLEGSGAVEGAAVAEALRRRTERTDIRRETGRVPVTISVGGIAVEGHFNIRQAIADADRRLYRAKRIGRNRVVLDEPAADDDASAA